MDSLFQIQPCDVCLFVLLIFISPVPWLLTGREAVLLSPELSFGRGSGTLARRHAKRVYASTVLVAVVRKLREKALLSPFSQTFAPPGRARRWRFEFNSHGQTLFAEGLATTQGNSNGIPAAAKVCRSSHFSVAGGFYLTTRELGTMMKPNDLHECAGSLRLIVKPH